MKEKDINSLDHTTWRCQYHVVFAPKYRRQAIYKEIKIDNCENAEYIRNQLQEDEMADQMSI